MRYQAVILLTLVLIASGCAANSTSEAPQNDTNSPAPQDSPDNQTQDSDSQPANDSGSSTVTVTYTDSGFQPQTVTIDKGDTVVWESETSTPMWVASNQHPVHSQYSGTSRTEHCSSGDQTSSAFDQCSSGQTFSFTFEKTGEWNYHNHQYSAHQGTVIVE